MESRYLGCLLGLATGDAVGTTVEFRPRGTFKPVTDMVGGGPFRLAAGQWTDDTSMALCLAESLLQRNGFDAHDQMSRYLRWRSLGHLSSTGVCFDIGATTQSALERFAATGDPYSGPTSRKTAGNGSLMRLAPVVLFYHPNARQVDHFSAESSRTTHGASEAVESCRLLGDILGRCLAGMPKGEVLDSSELSLAEPSVVSLAKMRYARKTAKEIVGSGYCVESLEAALWCFQTTHDFESAILAAANLGDDADTTAAIAGQIAGAFYGVDGIPSHWLERLHLRDTIAAMARGLLASAQSRHANKPST